jgi:hypothetical protein
MTPAGSSFATQRLVCIALLLGMTTFAIVVAVVLQQNEGRGLADHRLPELDDAVVFVGIGAGLVALAVRSLLFKLAARSDPEQRGMARFRATLVSLALLEGGCLFGLCVWMLNGNAVPGLAAALALLSLAVLVVPFTDPDAIGS